jgi:hypothetical protein
LAIDPPGPLRFFHSSAHGYATTFGTMLLAALVLGAAGLVASLVRRRAGVRIDRLQLAGAAFFGTWLVLGVGLLSNMQRLQPRYLEAATPAIAAVVGVGLAALVASARRGRSLAAAALVAAVTSVAVGGAVLAHAPTWAVVVAVAGAAGCGIVAASGARPQRATALTVLGLIAVLAVPASAAVKVAGRHRSAAGVPLRTSPARLAALSHFLIAHQGRARYEVASPNVVRAAPLITRDARPVLMLTSLYGRPLLDASRLRQLVAGGEVRYALLGRAACTSRGCAAVVRWARTHARDVSAPARQPRGTVYRLTATPPTGRAG